jgi:DNA-binding CsgD family transcriptional regulator
MRVAAVTGPLLEREEDLARIESALADARRGVGRFVVVEGPAGIGKTALLAAARTAAAASGMRVLRSRATEMESNFAFGVVRQLFEPPLAEASELERADLLQAAAGVAARRLGLPGAPTADEPASTGVDPSFAILHGLYWLSANLAAAGPLCMVVDDAHWADAASLRYLAFLLTRLEELGIALIVATRHMELLAAMRTDPATAVVRPAPLTRPAVAELLEAGLGRAPESVLVDASMRVTQGSPFLVREVVEAFGEGGLGSASQTVSRSIRFRLGRLPERAGRLARALAILEESDLHTAARLADLEDAEAADAADLLATAAILQPGRPLAFVHPIVRTALHTELSSAERAQGHRRAAALLAEQPDAGTLVAEHLLVSEPAGDDWVVDRLVEAARATERRGAFESAAVFLRRALAEPPSPVYQSVLLLELGMAEATAGLDGWADDMQRAVDTAPDAAHAAESAMVLARALNRYQRYAEAVDVLDRAQTALDHSSAEVALLLETSAVVAGMTDPATTASVARRRQTLRKRADDLTAPAEPLAVGALIAMSNNEPAEVCAELATRSVEAGAHDQAESALGSWFVEAWFARATLVLLFAERFAQARPLLDSSIAQARAVGDGGRLAICLAVRGWLALREGDPSAAEADARTALGATDLPPPPMYRVLNGGVLVKALVEQGELEAAEQALAPLDSHADSGFVTAAPLRLARGRLRAAQGRTADALEDFLGVGSSLTRALLICPGYLPWRSDAALAALAVGDPESAQRLADEELELARAFGAPRALGVAARVAGLVAGGDRGVSLLREAIDALGRGDARLERARALADLGAMLRRRNRRNEARELLREALDVAHRAGARPLAGYAEVELRATGARPRRVVLSGLDSLTASERRVAELAGQGLSNREIGQTLFVTARTVEGHLTSVFRKLEVDSREELPRALAGNAPVPA